MMRWMDILVRLFGDKQADMTPHQDNKSRISE